MARGFKILITLGLAVATMAQVAPAAAEPRVYVTSHFKVVADGKDIHCSWWATRCDFGNYFDENAEAKSEYTQYQDIAAWTPWLRWASVAAILAYGVVELGTDNSFDLGTGLVVFFVPWAAAGIVSGHAVRHLFRAVNIMNGVSPEQASFSRDDYRVERLAENAVHASLFQYSF